MRSCSWSQNCQNVFQCCCCCSICENRLHQKWGNSKYSFWRIFKKKEKSLFMATTTSPRSQNQQMNSRNHCEEGFTIVLKKKVVKHTCMYLLRSLMVFLPCLHNQHHCHHHQDDHHHSTCCARSCCFSPAATQLQTEGPSRPQLKPASDFRRLFFYQECLQESIQIILKPNLP